MKHLAPFFPKMKAPWTADAPLPGGENFDYAALKTSWWRPFLLLLSQ